MFFKSRKKMAAERLRQRYENEDIALFKRRMKTIMQIANQNLKQAHCGKPFPIRETVVVSCEDLLKIWDIAGTAMTDTPVHGR